MAVYTEVSDEALAAFLGQYAIGELVAFQGIAEGVENSNFLLRTRSGDYILTLYEKRVDPAELPWFLGLMQHLAGHGVRCPQPVAGRDGEALRRLADKACAVTTFLPGVWPRRVTQEHCAPLGAALASLHLAGAGYAPRRDNGLGPGAWGPLLDRCDTTGKAGREMAAVAAELRGAVRPILAAWPKALPIGHIHADLFPDNVFFLEGKVSGLIDFYFAATDFLAYDLAVCLNAWCFERDGSYNVTKSRALVAAYDHGRALTQAERRALPVLAAGAALRFAATRLYDWINTPADALVTRKDPLDYLRRLRFHQQAAGAGAYGI